MTKSIAWLTSLLVFAVALGSFILSYNALYQVAIDNGINPQLAYIWPLLVDFSLVVFSLAVVTAHLYSESTRKQWLLVAIYTIATVLFNCLHAPDNLLARVIATVPPVSLFFSFELLMMQLKNSMVRRNQQATITGYANALQQAQQAFDDLMQQVAAREQQIVTELQATITERDNQLVELQQQLDPVTTRRQLILQAKLDDPHLTQKALAELTGVSLSTIRADLEALNGSVK